MTDRFSAERRRMEHLFAEASRHLEELEARTRSEEQQRERILRDVQCRASDPGDGGAFY